ncbi:WD-40 repeat protein [Klebsormidium nitens]|uniref:WD-40 repeat protein n=1 Tax=Klebsormidium nitens TaxID=105231 RepID=A0A1Y1IN90_KLENI|nr:WD-40 repeat protein [Klebsormidium nitens]|eukprot:GAQ89588.1 WD-40 repeat protein [Klebsormidium nitens]
MSACQDHHIRLYNTDTLTEQKAFKDVVARDVGWSIVDTDFSPDQRMIIYSSWSNFVHICNVAAEFELHEALDFRPESRHFCLFSIKFSPDSREIIAGSSDNSVYIYDIETKKPTLVVDAHTDDVNSVCFAEDSPSMFYSASDDGICKVWDRRLLKGGSNDAVGVLVGHSEGITHVNSKGDGRYLLTNSKDQSIKLWDIRRMTNPSKIDKGHVPARRYWDYRWEDHSPRNHQGPCKNDTSLQTYRGHRVLQTLVRAYFSPVESTGQRYIYTGSTDGTVYIYDVVSGETVRKLSGHFATVRDVAWHPTLPLLATSSWDCTVGVWEHHRASES